MVHLWNPQHVSLAVVIALMDLTVTQVLICASLSAFRTVSVQQAQSAIILRAKFIHNVLMDKAAAITKRIGKTVPRVQSATVSLSLGSREFVARWLTLAVLAHLTSNVKVTAFV